MWTRLKPVTNSGTLCCAVKIGTDRQKKRSDVSRTLICTSLIFIAVRKSEVILDRLSVSRLGAFQKLLLGPAEPLNSEHWIKCRQPFSCHSLRLQVRDHFFVVSISICEGVMKFTESWRTCRGFFPRTSHHLKVWNVLEGVLEMIVPQDVMEICCRLPQILQCLT
jgi:hypothetical protein